jgi:ATP-dependent DNA ligase
MAEIPVILLAYDLLELGGVDLRDQPIRDRRRRLEELISQPAAGGSLQLSPVVPFSSWPELAELREQSRSRSAEGLMLKRSASPYRVGRQRGDWWKWKIDPFTIDAVLIQAQRGSGKRASLYTDYTFGVWSEGQLVPFAKAYSGLTDEEIRKVDAFVRNNTQERFGPVRAVKPELVFELGFEGIARSTRHKSGVAVRFPRILRWRQDKRFEEADTLKAIQKLLPHD